MAQIFIKVCAWPKMALQTWQDIGRRPYQQNSCSGLCMLSLQDILLPHVPLKYH